MAGPASLGEDLERIAELAAGFAQKGERVTAVLPAEPQPRERAYLCTLETGDSTRSWIVLDAAGRPIDERLRVRDTVTILALCELAVETAAGGDLDDLRSQLTALRLTENPPGIDETDEAVLELQRVLGTPPLLATPARLDAIGAATRRLELALGGLQENNAVQGSPFTAALKSASEVVAALLRDVEGAYRGELS